MSRALLIDLDGVLRRWPVLAGFQERFGIAESEIRAVAFASPLLQQAIQGKLQDGEWRAAIAKQLGAVHGKTIAGAAVGFWSRSAGEVVPDVASLLRRVSPPYTVVLATNATTRLNTDLEALGISSVFAAIANSSALGTPKPEAAFFTAALELAGVTPENALFVDDSFENIAAARRLGITAHRFQSAGLLADFLAERGAVAAA